MLVRTVIVEDEVKGDADFRVNGGDCFFDGMGNLSVDSLAQDFA